jgi:hypothetical protein
VGGPAQPTIRPGDARRPSSRAVAAALVGVAYTAALAVASWNGATDGDDDGTSVALGVVMVVVWIAASVLYGYLLSRLAFVLIPVAVVIPAVVGERMEEFDNELRYFNWALILVLNAAFAAVGAWLARRSA